LLGRFQDANPGRGDDPDRAISPAACIAVMRRKRHSSQPSAEPCGVTRAGRGMHHAGVVLDQKCRAFAEAALALHATFRAEREIFGNGRIRADQGRHPPEQHRRPEDSCRPRSAPTKTAARMGYSGFGENVSVAITPRAPPGRTLTCQPYRSHRRLTIDRPMPPPCE